MKWHVCRPPNTRKAYAEGDSDFVSYVEDLSQRPFHEVLDLHKTGSFASNTLVVPVAQNFPNVDAFTMDGNLYQVTIVGRKVLICNPLNHNLLTSMFGHLLSASYACFWHVDDVERQITASDLFLLHVAAVHCQQPPFTQHQWPSQST